jgi:hypothetical protein
MSLVSVSGKEFNETHPHTEFYKLLHEDLTHRGFTYKHGLNTDTSPFNSNGNYSGGGLYFSNKEHMPLFLHKTRYICRVTIPDDAQVVYFKSNGKQKEEEYEYKADSFYLDFKDKIDILSWEGWEDIDYLKSALRINPWVMQYIKDELITPELCKIVKENTSIKKTQITPEGEFIEVQNNFFMDFIDRRKQTPEVCESTVKWDGMTLQYVRPDLLTKKLCWLAVKEDSNALQYVPDRFLTAELCEMAVEKDPTRLEYVPDRLLTAELCLMAVERNGWALSFVPERFINAKLCETAVRTTIEIFKHIKNESMTPELCLFAVQKNGMNLQFVPYRFITPELCLMAVQQNGMNLQFVPDRFITPELCLFAVQKNGMNLQFVPDRFITPELCLMAVQQNGMNLQFVPDRFLTPELCETAVKQTPNALRFVKPEFLTPQVMYYASFRYYLVCLAANTLTSVCSWFRR